MSFDFKFEGVMEAVNYLTNTLPALENEAALYAVTEAHRPYLPDLLQLLMNLPVKHVEKQIRHRQKAATPLYLHNEIRQRARHIWQDILVKSSMYKDGRGAYAITGASDADQTPLDRFINSGSIHAGIRRRYTMNDAPTGVMPTFDIIRQVLANNLAVVEAQKVQLFQEKLLQLRRQAGERV